MKVIQHLGHADDGSMVTPMVTVTIGGRISDRDYYRFMRLADVREIGTLPLSTSIDVTSIIRDDYL